ncbi:TPA: NAD-dependent protein deacetylase [Pseudomonas aeruginosa]|nr:NAD-dependent protein deacetylase [Pseudomonas aeruginosa]
MTDTDDAHKAGHQQLPEARKMTDQNYKDHIPEIARRIEEADAILVGGASGMSTANQHDFYGYSKYFRDNFSEFQDAYGIRNLCGALYYRYKTSEERWAYLSKHGALLFDEPPGQTYVDLHAMIKDKNYFIVTTNQDLQFSKLFPDEKLCYPQGTSHYLQCGVPCHDDVYPSEEAVRTMAANITGTRVPKDLIPKCPRCGEEMEPWFRSPVFLEGTFWQSYMRKYQDFIEQNSHKKILLIELGVGPMTPNIIKHPFSVATYHWPKAFLVRINKDEPPTHELLRNKTITLDADIADVLRDLRTHMQAPLAITSN